jgi:hypothetical protein
VVSFDASATTFFGGATGVQYVWTFSDASGQTTQTTSTSAVSHTFNTPGPFQVSVQVTDSANRVGVGSVAGTVQ